MAQVSEPAHTVPPVPTFPTITKYRSRGGLRQKIRPLASLDTSAPLWSYHYGNLGPITHYGVIVKFPSNKG